MHIRVGQDRFLDLTRRINAEISLEYIPEKEHNSVSVAVERECVRACTQHAEEFHE